MTMVATTRRREVSVVLAAMLVAAGVLALPVPRAAASGPTVVSLTFDDGLADQVAAAQTIAAHGMRATYYVNTGRLGASGYMTQADVVGLQAAGHEVGGHTINHVDLPTVSTAEQQRQVCDDRTALAAMGVAASSFAYPYGDYVPATESIVGGCGYSSARTVGGIVSATSCSGCPWAESIPPTDPYGVMTSNSIQNTTSLADIETLVTQAETHGGGWVVLVFHHVCVGCGVPYEVAPATLTALLDWLAPRAAQGTTVQTVNQVMGTAPPPTTTTTTTTTTTPPAGGLAPNGSLETDANTDGVPDCWQTQVTGKSSATWKRTTVAHTGRYAEQVAIKSYTNGDRRLVVTPDSGTCAPAAPAGAAFTASAWVQGSGQAQLVATYRQAGGAWVAWAAGPTVVAGTGWSQTSMTVPALPSGATNISVGLLVKGKATVSMDDFVLIRTA